MRRENDFYPTPAGATQALLSRVQSIGGSVMEPCVGAGDIAAELEGDPRIEAVVANDLDKRWTAATTHADATDKRWWNALPMYDWVITNPPFVAAHKILPLACEHASRGVAMLLRLTFLEPCEGRALWLSVNPPHRLIVLPRISFTGDGNTDLVTCAWYVWEWGSTQRGIEIVLPAVDARQGSLLAHGHCP